MALVHGYTYDIFISYAHRDNKPLFGGHQGWVNDLHQALEQRFDELFGKQLKIWRDPYLDGTHVLEKELADRVTNAAVLMAILSPNYLTSDWCQKERYAFCRIAEQRGGLSAGNRSRLVKVVKTHVPREQHPAELQDSGGFDFYQIDQATKEPVDFRPETQAAQFIQKVESLARGIKRLIDHLQPLPAAEAPPVEKTIYLAEASPDLEDDRERVKSDLLLKGYYVLPDEDLPAKAPAPDTEAKVRGYLSRCRMSVHFIGAIYGRIPAMAKGRSIVRIQHELALERGNDPQFKRLIWMPNGLKEVEAEQQEFIKYFREDPDVLRGAELVQGNRETLKTAILEPLKPKAKPKTPKTNRHGDQSPARVYLVYDESDYPETRPIRGYLLEQQLEVLRPVGKTKPQDFEEHKELLLLADAVMVYYGRTNDPWAWQKLRELQKLPGYGRQRPLLAKAFYLSAPPTDDKDDFITNEAMVIKGYEGFRPELLAEFIDQIKRAKGVGR